MSLTPILTVVIWAAVVRLYFRGYASRSWKLAFLWLMGAAAAWLFGLHIAWIAIQGALAVGAVLMLISTES